MNPKIVVFGEVLKRITPVGSQCLYGQQDCSLSFGGSEMNVGVALKKMGFDVRVVTKLPNNAYGDAALATLNSYGLDTSFVVRGGEHMGEYLVEPGVSRMSPRCTYDRKNSVLATACQDEFPWEKIFDGAALFHISGITPALSSNVREIVSQALQYAKRHNIYISFDVNYRAKLFATKNSASQLLKPIALCSDMLFVNEDEADILGIDVNANEMINPAVFSEVVCQMLKQYPNLKVIVHGTRQASEKADCVLSGVYWKRSYGSEILSRSNDYYVDIIDPIGAGDALAAAMIATTLWQKFPTHYAGNTLSTYEGDSISFAMAACALKHIYRGDVSHASIDDIVKFMNEKGTLAVKR